MLAAVEIADSNPMASMLSDATTEPKLARATQRRIVLTSPYNVVRWQGKPKVAERRLRGLQADIVIIAQEISGSLICPAFLVASSQEWT